MKPEQFIYKNPEGVEDVSLDDYIPFASPPEPDRSPRWLRVLVGDGGVPGQQIWVRFFADDAPRGLPAFETDAPSPGVPDAWVVSPVLAAPFALADVRARKQKPKCSPESPLLLDIAEAATLLGISTSALYSRVERGQVKGVVRSGRRIQFHKALLDEKLRKAAKLWPSRFAPGSVAASRWTSASGGLTGPSTGTVASSM